MQSAKRARRGLNKRQESLAKGVAAGLTLRDAGLAAGYSGKSDYIYDVAKKEDYIKRVSVLRKDRAWGGSADLAPAIDMLMGAAEKILGNNDLTPAACDAAQRLIAEAARLKQKLPKRASGDLSLEEWVTRFGPKS